MRAEASNRSHHWLRVAGILLVVMSFAYILEALWLYRADLLSWDPSPGQLVLLVAAALLYGLAGFLLSGAWYRLNRICGRETVSYRRCTRIYGATQLAKYVPGNVFHFIGRHAEGVRAGLSHLTLGCSATLEMIGLLFAAGLLSLVGLFYLGAQLSAILPLSRGSIFAVVAAGFVSLFVLLPRLIHRIRPETVTEPRQFHVSRLLPVIGQYLLFFMLCSVLMTIVTATTQDLLSLRILSLAFACYPLAWLAGYLVPGASAGFGIREAVIMLVLGLAIAPWAATLVALLMRVVTVLGDLIFYFLSRLGRE